MDIYYDCKTCGQPYGFGRMTFEPAECNRCDPPLPYVSEPSDFELGEQTERERIAKLLEGIEFSNDDPHKHTLEITLSNLADGIRKGLGTSEF
jgi:hypothetical protein